MAVTRRHFFANAFLFSFMLSVFAVSFAIGSPDAELVASRGVTEASREHREASGDPFCGTATAHVVVSPSQEGAPNESNCYYDVETFLLADFSHFTTEKSFFLKISGGPASKTERKMLKDAESASFTESRQARRNYEAWYIRSVTEGGKNAVHNSVNLKEWRDALKSVQSA
ncbi:MAG: hypothetical protein LBT31_03780 [Synergistaceae bacterium]|jgi:hypothetical protein|nr:hypothetical protein [Synergistaceae bacterium]